MSPHIFAKDVHDLSDWEIFVLICEHPQCSVKVFINDWRFCMPKLECEMLAEPKIRQTEALLSSCLKMQHVKISDLFCKVCFQCAYTSALDSEAVTDHGNALCCNCLLNLALYALKFHTNSNSKAFNTAHASQFWARA